MNRFQRLSDESAEQLGFVDSDWQRKAIALACYTRILEALAHTDETSNTAPPRSHFAPLIVNMVRGVDEQQFDGERTRKEAANCFAITLDATADGNVFLSGTIDEYEVVSDPCIFFKSDNGIIRIQSDPDLLKQFHWYAGLSGALND